MKEDKIQSNQKVTAYVNGSTVEFSANNASFQKSIVVLSDHKYLDLKTLKIKEMDTNASSRVDNLSSVKRTMKKLRRLIDTNFHGGNDQLWVTLTYATDINAHNEGDTAVVYRDFKIFMQRLRQRIMRVEYIAVLEPQSSGRWHLHALLKSADGARLVIPNDLTLELWGRGFTSTKRLSQADNVASYVIAYVSNLKIGSTTKKGARLHLYPKGVRIYRRSRGIINPTKIPGTKEEILRKFKLNENDKRAYYERSFVTKAGTEVITQTEFYDRKEVPNDVKSNSDQKRTRSYGVSTKSSEEDFT